jgi:hypothetical protein
MRRLSSIFAVAVFVGACTSACGWFDSSPDAGSPQSGDDGSTPLSDATIQESGAAETGPSDGASDAQHDAHLDGASGDGEGGTDGSSTGDGAEGDGADGGTGEGAVDAPFSDAACPTPVVVPSQPSTGTVSFVLTNASTADRYVVDFGQLCDAFAIAGAARSAPWSCGCECPMPQVQMSFAHLAPGASVTLPWDGRAVSAYYDTYQDCSLFGHGGPPCATIQNAAMSPVSVGSHQATFAVAQQPPSSSSSQCLTTSTGFQCTLPSTGGAPAPGICDATSAGVAVTFVQQSFAVPATGNTTVNVSIN